MTGPRYGVVATPPRQPSPSRFAFAPPPGSPEWPGADARMGSDSPRSWVAHHFRALDLDGTAPTCGGGALPRQPPRADTGAGAPQPPAFDVGPASIDGAGPDAVMEDAQPPTMRERDMAAPGPSETGPPADGLPEDTESTPPTAAKPKRPTKKRKTFPATKRAGARARKKTRTKKPPAQQDADSPEREIVDPLRASLTWQEDEITVYDPDDDDDDGEGMDGVGFQPPPSAARATARRKLGQLAEYRRMVEREAREGRRRRRGRRGTDERVSRVRFLETETVIEVL